MDFPLVSRRPIQRNGLPTVVAFDNNEVPLRQVSVPRWKQRQYLISSVNRVYYGCSTRKEAIPVVRMFTT
jgi:hypothetical protein